MTKLGDADWRSLEQFSFGDSPELADELAELVLAGKKRATCWAASEGPQTEIGKRMVMLDGSGVPRAVVETVELTQRRFGEVDDAFGFDEGEDDHMLASWRRAHRNYFGRQGTFSTDMLLYCERFRLASRIDPGASASGLSIAVYRSIKRAAKSGRRHDRYRHRKNLHARPQPSRALALGVSFARRPRARAPRRKGHSGRADGDGYRRLHHAVQEPSARRAQPAAACPVAERFDCRLDSRAVRAVAWRGAPPTPPRECRATARFPVGQRRYRSIRRSGCRICRRPAPSAGNSRNADWPL